MEEGLDRPCCALALAYTTPPAQPLLEQRPARPAEEGPLACPCLPLHPLGPALAVVCSVHGATIMING